MEITTVDANNEYISSVSAAVDDVFCTVKKLSEYK